jgi:hypothetical protein
MKLLICSLFFLVSCTSGPNKVKPVHFTFEDFEKIKLGSKPDPQFFTEKTKSPELVSIYDKKFAHWEWNGMAENPSVELLTNYQGEIIEKVFIPKFKSFESNLANVVNAHFKGDRFQNVPLRCSYGTEYIMTEKETGYFIVVDNKQVAAIGASTIEVMELRLKENSQKCNSEK